LSIDRENGERNLKIESIATGISMRDYASGAFTACDSANPRRRISLRARRGMGKLQRAIQYLSGEFLSEGGSASFKDERIQANMILMACNRGIYFECPVVSSAGERFGPIVDTVLARIRSHMLETAGFQMRSAQPTDPQADSGA